MLELLFEGLLILLELFGEFLFEAAYALASDLLSREAQRFLRFDIANAFLSALAYGIFGAFAGAISTAVLPHRLLPPPHIRGISLLLSPLVTGLVMYAVGTFLRRRGKRVSGMESFGNGFAFGLGMALLRFITIS